MSCCATTGAFLLSKKEATTPLLHTTDCLLQQNHGQETWRNFWGWFKKNEIALCVYIGWCRRIQAGRSLSQVWCRTHFSLELINLDTAKEDLRLENGNKRQKREKHLQTLTLETEEMSWGRGCLCTTHLSWKTVVKLQFRQCKMFWSYFAN